MPAPVPSRHSKDDTPVSALSRAQLLDVLSDLVRDLERLDLALSADGIEAARTLRDGLIGQVRDQVIPRLQDADVPSIVVVGGSTGAGKSTLVNSVLGQEVSVAGVLRPTTRTPVLVANPEDMDSLSEHPLTQVCRQEVSAAIPAGLALIDASDLDSVHEANRALAGRLLEAADLWLFVTTAARYGDQTPWTTLEEAARRETPIGVVLNRVPAKILPEVRRDLITRLQGLGLSEAPFFVVPDAGPHEGLLSGDGVSELRDWLQLLAGRHRAAGLVRRTGRGVWSTLRADLERLAEAVEGASVLGRVTPEQKRALVRALKSRGHVVAMTGDGVNDALALKDADLGIAMGNGAPATKAVARLVLLKGEFSALPGVVAQGRRVMANTERIASLFLAKTIYASLIAVVVSAMAVAYPFLTRQFKVVSSLTIGIPAFVLALAPSNQRYREGFLGRVLSLCVPAGLMAGTVTLSTYLWLTLTRAPRAQVTTATTLVLITCGLWLLTLTARPLTSWRLGLVALMGTIAVLGVVAPPVRAFFLLAWPTPGVWWVIALMAGLAVGGIELVHLVRRRIVRGRG